MHRNYSLLQLHKFSRRSFVSYRSSSSVSDGGPREDEILKNVNKIYSIEIDKRQKEAKKSVLVAVSNKQAAHSLYDHAKTFGIINKCYLYSLPNKQKNVLIEYEDTSSFTELLSNCNFNYDHNTIPIHSNFLLYKKTNDVKIINDSIGEENLLDNHDLYQNLMQENTISDQIRAVYSAQNVTDLETRIRFIICHQLEKTLAGIFPLCKVLPFGSSVNGFGRRNCDLDMILQLQSEKRNQSKGNQLYFQSRPPLANRMLVQRSLDTLGGMLHDFVPGCLRVQRILHARVPILKFHHQFTNVDCDITLSNLSGYYMSELLNIFSQLDSRVQLIAFTVRKWADANHLTNTSPGKWITNFSLLLMVIFYLQRRVEPILPSVSKLKQLAEKEDRKVVEGIDCTYLRNVEKIPKTVNNENVGDLMKEFFSFYANFNFKSQGISIHNGQEIIKPEYDAMYIQNPLEHTLNVSKNVSHDEVTRLQNCMQTSLWKLETYGTPKSKSPWGLCKIFETIEGTDNSSKRFDITLENLFVNPNNSVLSSVAAEHTKLDLYVDKMSETEIVNSGRKSKKKKSITRSQNAKVSNSS